MFKYKKKVLALSQVALQKQIFSKKKKKGKKYPYKTRSMKLRKDEEIYFEASLQNV